MRAYLFNFKETKRLPLPSSLPREEHIHTKLGGAVDRFGEVFVCGLCQFDLRKWTQSIYNSPDLLPLFRSLIFTRNANTLFALHLGLPSAEGYNGGEGRSAAVPAAAAGRGPFPRKNI